MSVDKVKMEDIEKYNKVGLMTSSHSYKPFRYPWAFDFWKRQQQVHWMPEEVPLGEDCKDWVIKLNDGERNLLYIHTDNRVYLINNRCCCCLSY